MAQNARILIVDHDREVADGLGATLQEGGYGSVSSTTDPSAVLGICAETSPDLLLLDLEMPGPDGFEVMELLKPWVEGRWFPIVVLANGISSEQRERAIAAGAKEFLPKPPQRDEMLLRIRNLLEIRSLHRELRRQSLLLDRELESRTADHRKARLEILQRLAIAVEYRDDESGEHSERVGRTSARIAQELGFGREQVEMLRFAAPLHDIGKVGVPESVLHKNDALTKEEFDVVKRHVSVGHFLLGGTDIEILQMAEQIVVSHHEWWDGSGYPDGVSGDDIPMLGRIVALADSFDALTHDRRFRAAMPVADALAEIRSLSGRQFDPMVVRAFERIDHETLV